MRLVKILNKSLYAKLPLLRFSETKAIILPEVEERIMNILRQSPKCDTTKLNKDSTFEELGFDSLDAVELIVAFEEDLGFDIPDEEATNSIKKINDALVVFSKYFAEKNIAKPSE